MPLVAAKNESDKIDQSVYVFHVKGLSHVESKDVKVLVNRNVMPGMDGFSVWVPRDAGLFKTVEDKLINDPTSLGLLASLQIPEEIEKNVPVNNRNQLLRGWYAKLYTACYLEIFKQYPHLYPVLMKCMNITTYPELWTDQFNTLMNDCVLGKLDNKYMTFGYLNLPSQGGCKV